MLEVVQLGQFLVGNGLWRGTLLLSGVRIILCGHQFIAITVQHAVVLQLWRRLLLRLYLALSLVVIRAALGRLNPPKALRALARLAGHFDRQDSSSMCGYRFSLRCWGEWGTLFTVFDHIDGNLRLQRLCHTPHNHAFIVINHHSKHVVGLLTLLGE